MKASPSGHAPVCCAILPFAVLNFPRTDTSDLCDTLFGTNEEDFYKEIPFHGFPVWNKGPSQRKLRRIDLPRSGSIKGELSGDEQNTFGKNRGVDPLYPKSGKEIG